jgi:hypothetical protein
VEKPCLVFLVEFWIISITCMIEEIKILVLHTIKSNIHNLKFQLCVMKVGQSGKIIKRRLKNATYIEIDGKNLVLNTFAMHLGQLLYCNGVGC